MTALRGPSAAVPRTLRIRRLRAADAERFRALRLESLRSAPAAFCIDSADEERRTTHDFAERLERDLVFGAESASQLVGIVGLERQEGAKHAHRGIVWGLYVMPSHRRSGISRRLMERLERDAGSTVEILDLEVVVGNDAAKFLYDQLGYEVYGIQNQALKLDGVYYGRLLMAKVLRLRAGP